ncbi:MAG: hypothetical protein AB2L21_00220, partial [Anaerolineaceae bacterium]
DIRTNKLEGYGLSGGRAHLGLDQARMPNNPPFGGLNAGCAFSEEEVIHFAGFQNTSRNSKGT